MRPQTVKSRDEWLDELSLMFRLRLVAGSSFFFLGLILWKSRLIGFPIGLFSLAPLGEAFLNQPYPFITRRVTNLRLVTWAHLCIDIVLITWGIHCLGEAGVTYGRMAYVLPISFAAYMMSVWAGVGLATLCVAAHVFMVWYGSPAMSSAIESLHLPVRPASVMTAVLVEGLILYLVAYFSGFLGAAVRKKNKETAETETMLERSEKEVRGLRRLASGLAHELKNPMAIVMQAVNYLERNEALDAEGRAQLLRQMKDAVIKANQVTQSLLEFSKTRHREARLCQFNTLIEESLDLVSRQLRLDSVEVHKDLDGRLPRLMLDEGQIKKALINLILNSVHAMPKGGILTLRTHAARLKDVGKDAGRKARSVLRQGQLAVVAEITDTGIGIPESQLEGIFDPFFSTNPPGQGTGMGLSIVKSIIDAHGGRIVVASKEGQGTKSTITLPIGKEEEK